MRIHALLGAVVAILGPAAAQCSTFLNTPPGTDLALGDDDVRTVGLGFSFAFGNQTYSTISICSNGFVWLGTVGVDDYFGLGADFFDNEAELLAFGPRIAVCWDDWNPTAGGGVFFRNDGTGSVSVVWKNVPRFGTVGGTLNAELVLQSTGEFWLHYDPAMTAPGSSAIVGTSAGGGTGANPVVWSTLLPTAPTIPGSTGYQLFAASGFNLAGTTIRQTPLTPAAIDHVVQTGALTSCTAGTYPPLAGDPVAFGVGCPAPALVNPSAIYEAFTATGGANPTDLSGLSLTFVRAGNTYVTVAGPGFDASYQTQGTLVAQGDETIATGLSVGPMGEFPFSGAGFAAVEAASNGFLFLQPGGFSDFSPTAAEFLADGARIAPHWTDYDFSFVGSFYWSNNNPAFCMATWENVEMWNQPGTANTFQAKLWANGDITFSYGTVASAFDDVIVGITLGNLAADPGSSDLSASPTNTIVRDIGSLVQPLLHTVSGPASINTPFSLIARNLNGGTFGAFALGGTPQAIDLSGIGMTGCNSYCSLDEIFLVAASGGQLTYTVFVPPLPILYGSTAHTQAAVFSTVNPFGLIASNRMTVTVGM